MTQLPIRKILRWTFSTLVLCILILAGAILNPQYLYAGKTQIENVRVLHDGTWGEEHERTVLAAIELFKKSELYDPSTTIDLCIGRQSIYPTLIQQLSGPAFGACTMNKAVILTNIHVEEGYAEREGKHWKLAELFAHEMVHCLQHNQFGNLVSHRSHTWIIEGYPEYVVRNQQGSEALCTYLDLYLKSEAAGVPNSGWVPLEDHNGSPMSYLRYQLLIQYLIEVEGKSYDQILQEQEEATAVWERLLSWRTNMNHPEF